MYLDRKIIGRKHGEAHRQLDALIGLVELRESVNLFGHDSPSTRLIPDLKETGTT